MHITWKRIDYLKWLSGCVQDGRTALHCAEGEGHLPVVEFLVNRGASLDPVTRVSFFVMTVSSSSRHPGRGVDINNPDLASGSTRVVLDSFHKSVWRGRLSLQHREPLCDSHRSWIFVLLEVGRELL